MTESLNLPGMATAVPVTVRSQWIA